MCHHLRIDDDPEQHQHRKAISRLWKNLKELVKLWIADLKPLAVAGVIAQIERGSVASELG
jgi:hypothetical protein